MTDLDVKILTGREVAADPAPWIGAYEDVYADDLHLADHNDPPISDRLARHAKRPGFRLYGVWDGGEVAGYLYGYALPEDSLWWEGFVPDPGTPTGITREWPGRTAAGCEVLVRRQWRERGVARLLNDAFLDDRTEERATGLIAASNDVMLSIYERYGWRRIGSFAPYPGWREHIAVVRELR